jgi:hypothetical protein
MFALPGHYIWSTFVARQKAIGARCRRWRCLRHVERLEPRQLLTGVTYQGGPLINNVAVEPVFLGQAWTANPSLEQNAAQLDQFFAYVTNSAFMDLLPQYGTVQAGPIGRGLYVGQVNIPQNAWSRSTVSDATIQTMLSSEINTGAIAAPDNNRLLFVFTPPNIVVSQGGSRSNGYPVGFAGYHNSFVDSAGQLVRYAVVPDPIGNDQVAGLTAFQQQTAAASHELAEATTDPDGTSWWDDSNDATSGYEIGDFARLSADTVYLNGYAVEKIWSNSSGSLAAPLGATLTPTATTSPPTTGGNLPSTSNVPANLGAVAESLAHAVQYDSAFLSAAYTHYLGRSVDTGGLNYWVMQMQLGLTDEQLESSLLSSSEYAQLHASTNASWVLGLYSDLLGRPADGAGLSYWLGRLQAGESRYQVAMAIATSAEREAIVVANDYQMFLGRSTSAGDTAYWVNVFEQGAQNEDVIAGFLSSPEYYNSSAKGQGSNLAWVDSVYHDLFQGTPSTSDLSYWLGQVA